MKRKKQVREAIIVLSIVAAILFGVAAVYAISKIPEESFVEKMSVPQMSFKNFGTFGEAYSALEQKEVEFMSKKTVWSHAEGVGIVNSEIPVGDFKPVSNLSEIRDYFNNFMAATPVIIKAEILLFGREIPYGLTFDEAAVKRAFASSGIEQGVANAYYAWDGKLLVHDEQIGIGINAVEVAAALESYFENFQIPAGSDLPLVTKNPEIRTAFLRENADKAAELAGKTISLKDDKGQTWKIVMQDHVDWLLPQSGTGAFILNPELFTTYIGNEIATEITSEPSPVTIAQNEDGAISFEGSARNGKEINMSDLLATFTDDLNGDIGEVNIPVNTIEPEITVSDSLKAKGITDLISVGYSTLKGSPTNRIHNIKYGVSKFNGVIIAPDEEFSFTKVLGHVDAAHGWLPELVIKGNDTLPEFGGGLCQVSTTMYRAALYGGLPITARTNHSYAVSYYAFPYGYGLDATVYEPWPDLRFKNDTGASILVQSYVDGTDVFYVFYGTNDGRYVQMSGPAAYNYKKNDAVLTEYTSELAEGVRKLKEHAHTGFDVDWYRSVFNADGSVRIDKENIHSSYQARPVKYQEGVSADDPRAGTTASTP